MTKLNEEQQFDYFVRSLRYSVQGLASPADVQLALFDQPVCKADEIAEEFDMALEGLRGPHGTSSRQRWIAPDQMSLLLEIDATLGEMSGPKPFWSDEELRTQPEWNRVRALAAQALEAFGWEPVPLEELRSFYNSGVTVFFPK